MSTSWDLNKLGWFFGCFWPTIWISLGLLFFFDTRCPQAGTITGEQRRKKQRWTLIWFFGCFWPTILFFGFGFVLFLWCKVSTSWDLNKLGWFFGCFWPTIWFSLGLMFFFDKHVSQSRDFNKTLSKESGKTSPGFLLIGRSPIASLELSKRNGSRVKFKLEPKARNVSLNFEPLLELSS